MCNFYSFFVVNRNTSAGDHRPDGDLPQETVLLVLMIFSLIKTVALVAACSCEEFN